MNRKEINEMMKRQALVVRLDSPLEKRLAWICFGFAFLVLLLV